MLRFSLFFLSLFACIELFAYTPISDTKQKLLLSEFDYTPKVKISQDATSGCTGEDVVFTTTYPQKTSPLKIEARGYIPEDTSVPFVILLPPIGGVNMLDKAMAKTFCNNNIAALIITTNFTGFDGNTLMPIADHDEAFRRAVSAVKGAMVYASSRPEINTAKMGIFGVSLGGILGSLAFSVIKELSAANFIVNGGDIPYILAYSEQKEVKKLREIRMENDNIATAEDYEKILRDNLMFDPMHFALLVLPDTVKQFLSTNDTNVPTIKQNQYHEAIGSPKEVEYLTSGHVGTVINVLFPGGTRQKIADWFGSRFKLDNPRLRPPVTTPDNTDFLSLLNR